MGSPKSPAYTSEYYLWERLKSIAYEQKSKRRVNFEFCNAVQLLQDRLHKIQKATEKTIVQCAEYEIYRNEGEFDQLI